MKNWLKIGFLFTLLNFNKTYAQSPISNWLFGKNVWLKFSQNGAPEIKSGGQTFTFNGTSAISDANGELLFYCDGNTVWNKNHQIMSNGTDLISTDGVLSNNGSWQQSALIVPRPGSSAEYYIFTIGRSTPLYYSLVNMNLDGGLGAVTQKNILLDAGARYRMAATYHANQKDIWLVTRNDIGSTVYKSYLITADSVHTLPVVNTTDEDSQVFSYGRLNFSPGGDKLLSINPNFYPNISIIKFNRETGVFDGAVTSGFDMLCPSQNGSAFHGCFSPDGSKIYTTNFIGNGSINVVYQYNANATTCAELAASQKVVATVTDLGNKGSVKGLQIGEDCKIYALRAAYKDAQGNPAPDSRFIDVIHNPNEEGAACNYEAKAIILPDTMGAKWMAVQYFSGYAACCGSNLRFLSVFKKSCVAPGGFGKIVASAIGGCPTTISHPYTFNINYPPGNTTFQSSGVFNNLPVGTYLLTIKDACGCRVSRSVTLGN